MDHILSIVLFWPLAALFVLVFIPSSNPRAVKLWANIASFCGFLVSLPLVFNFDKRGIEFLILGRHAGLMWSFWSVAAAAWSAPRIGPRATARPARSHPGEPRGTTRAALDKRMKAGRPAWRTGGASLSSALTSGQPW